MSVRILENAPHVITILSNLNSLVSVLNNGFSVSNKAYLVYYNGKKHEPMFNQKLEFDLHLVKLDCDDAWVEEAVLAAKNTLDGDMPKSSKNCENCNYLRKRWDVSQKDSAKLVE